MYEKCKKYQIRGNGGNRTWQSGSGPHGGRPTLSGEPCPPSPCHVTDAWEHLHNTSPPCIHLCRFDPMEMVQLLWILRLTAIHLEESTDSKPPYQTFTEPDTLTTVVKGPIVIWAPADMSHSSPAMTLRPKLLRRLASTMPPCTSDDHQRPFQYCLRSVSSNRSTSSTSRVFISDTERMLVRITLCLILLIFFIFFIFLSLSFISSTYELVEAHAAIILAFMHSTLGNRDVHGCVLPVRMPLMLMDLFYAIVGVL